MLVEECTDDILNNRITDLTNFVCQIYEKLSKAKYIKNYINKHNRCGMAELLYLCELSYDECIDSINELFKVIFNKMRILVILF